MKYFFLSLLAHQPTHGYDLLQTYEELFASVLPSLNAGQIYTTLSRLERDGLVSHQSIEQENKPDKRIYQLSQKGYQSLEEWFRAPLSGPRIKDTFFLKLISAQMTDIINPLELIHMQRQQYLQSLHDLNVLIVKPDIAGNAEKEVLIQGAILHLKADLEWLDLCENAFS